MIDYREILRLSSQGVSQRGIAVSCDCSRNTIAKVLEEAHKKGIGWPLKDGITNGGLQEMLFPERSMPTLRKRPDYEQVHRELAKSSVPLRDRTKLTCTGLTK